MSNYFDWDGREQAEAMIQKYNFEIVNTRERTFNTYSKLDDIHANGLHDYLKYLKFGYGRATDDASQEVREGRMTREQAIEFVEKYDSVRPSDTDIFLKNAQMSESELLNIIEPLRDKNIWGKDSKGNWFKKDSVINHKNDKGIDKLRIKKKENYRPFLKAKSNSYSIESQKDYEIL